MRDTTPKKGFSHATFRDESMDVRIPLKRTTKGMKDADETGDEMLRLIEIIEHAKNDGLNGVKKTIEKGTVTTKEITKIIRDSEHTMSVGTGNHLDGHGSRPLLRVKITAGRTESALAMERDEFHCTTRRAAVHDAAVSRIAAVNHTFNIIDDGGTEIIRVLEFFKMVRKNLLQNVHGNIIQQKMEFSYPSRLRGQGC